MKFRVIWSVAAVFFLFCTQNFCNLSLEAGRHRFARTGFLQRIPNTQVSIHDVHGTPLTRGAFGDSVQMQMARNADCGIEYVSAEPTIALIEGKNPDVHPSEPQHFSLSPDAYGHSDSYRSHNTGFRAPSVGGTIAALATFAVLGGKALYNSLIKEKPCTCPMCMRKRFPDFYGVYDMVPNKLAQLYDALHYDQYANHSNKFPNDLLRSCGVKKRLDELDDATQALLFERLEKERGRRINSRMVKLTPLSTGREEQEKQERIKQEKITQQKPMRDFFLERATEVQTYEQDLAQDIKKDDDLYPKDRLQRRRDAVQKAIQEQFKISYQRYTLSNQASSLLKQHNIDATVFGECVGNAIQQEAHAEFIEVLNSGAELYSEKDGMSSPNGSARTGLPGVAHLSEAWTGTLGNLCLIGVDVNTAGDFLLAHNISDISFCIYNFAKTSADLFLNVVDTLTDWGDALVEGTKIAGRFGKDVVHEAFIKPFVDLAVLSHSTRKDPEGTRKLINTFLYESLIFLSRGLVVMESIDSDPLSSVTKQFVQEFRNDYLEPTRLFIAQQASEFQQLSSRDKAVKISALGLQLGTSLGLSKVGQKVAQESFPLVKFALVADAELGGGGAAALGLNLGNVSVTPVSATVLADVGAAVGKVFPVAVGARGVAHAMEATGVVASGGQPPKKTKKPKKTKTAREKAEKTRKRNIRPPEEIIYECKRLAGRKIKWQGNYDPAKLKGVELPEEIIFTRESLEHVFSGKVEVPPGNAPLKIGGYHSDFKGRAIKQSGMNMTTEIRCPKTGAVRKNIRLAGKEKWKTLFPENLTPEEVLALTEEAMQNVFKVKSLEYGRISYLGKTSGGMTINVITEANGKAVTFYPKVSW